MVNISLNWSQDISKDRTRNQSVARRSALILSQNVLYTIINNENIFHTLRQKITIDISISFKALYHIRKISLFVNLISSQKDNIFFFGDDSKDCIHRKKK